MHAAFTHGSAKTCKIKIAHVCGNLEGWGAPATRKMGCPLISRETTEPCSVRVNHHGAVAVGAPRKNPTAAVCAVPRSPPTPEAGAAPSAGVQQQQQGPTTSRAHPPSNHLVTEGAVQSQTPLLDGGLSTEATHSVVDTQRPSLNSSRATKVTGAMPSSPAGAGPFARMAGRGKDLGDKISLISAPLKKLPKVKIPFKAPSLLDRAEPYFSGGWRSAQGHGGGCPTLPAAVPDQLLGLPMSSRALCPGPKQTHGLGRG